VQEHGVSPPRLEALVPRYLGQVPVDGFVPGPIGYAPARGVVYSVGEDFVDVAGGDDPQPGDAAEPALAL
jgi:hypothetical protein